MAQITIPQMADALSDLFETQLRIKGASLSQQIVKARRALPRRLRRKANTVAEAAQLIQNPKLARMIEVDRVAADYKEVAAHLRDIDPVFHRNTRILTILGQISAIIIALFAFSVWYLWKEGQI